MLIFLLILCILLSGVELYIRNRISFIISKPFVPLLPLYPLGEPSAFRFSSSSCLWWPCRFSPSQTLVFYLYPSSIRILHEILRLWLAVFQISFQHNDPICACLSLFGVFSSLQVDSNLRSLALPRHLRLLWFHRLRTSLPILLIRSAITTSSSRLPSGFPDSLSPSIRSTSSFSSSMCVLPLQFIVVWRCHRSLHAELGRLSRPLQSVVLRVQRPHCVWRSYKTILLGRSPPPAHEYHASYLPGILFSFYSTHL